MKKATSYWMIPVISIGMLSCNSASEEPAKGAKTETTVFDIREARSTIDSMNAKFSAGVKNGDSVALASYYSADAELMFSNSEPIKGTGILSAWGGVIRSGVKDFRLTTTDLAGNADLLVETGTYEMYGDSNSFIDKGKYVVVYKKENGEWKLYRDIGNSNMPSTPTK